MEETGSSRVQPHIACGLIPECLNRPSAAFSRSTTPRRSRIRGEDTRPLFTCRGLFVLATLVVNEVDDAVNTSVCAPFSLLLRERLQQRDGPILELVAVLQG